MSSKNRSSNEWFGKVKNSKTIHKTCLLKFYQGKQIYSIALIKIIETRNYDHDNTERSSK